MLSFAAYLAQSQRRLLCSRLCPSPRIVISSVSGYRAPGFGFLRCFSPAVCSPLRRLRELFGALPALGHISEPSAGKTRLPPSGGIRISSLAAPAINQSGRGSCAVFIALLYERLTRPESSAFLCAAICGTAATFLIPHSACARHKPERARQLRRIYRASVRASYTPGERHLSVYGDMRHCRTVPNSAFRISNQRWRGLRRPLP